jgi:hypothetical protein
MTTARVTQAVLEAAQQGASEAQGSQLALEVSTPFVGTAVPPGGLTSQLVLEVSVALLAPVVLSGFGVEAASQPAMAGSDRSEAAMAGSQASQAST